MEDKKGIAVVRIRVAQGRYVMRSLGKFGSDEAKKKYVQLIKEVESDGVTATIKGQPGLMLIELAGPYFQHQREWLSNRDFHRHKVAINSVLDLYGETVATEFGPLALSVVRDSMVRHGYCRRLINQMVSIIRQWFRFCVSKELIPTETWLALKALEPLKKNRTIAPDHPKVLPVDSDVVERTIKHLPGMLADMVRLQQYTGMRPGEVCLMHTSDIIKKWRTVDGVEVWLYRLERHKTRWRGFRREIPLGPKAQLLLRKYMKVEGFLFNPRECYRKTHPHLLKNRGSRAMGDHFNSNIYQKAILRACRKAQLPKWSPNQLRHSVGTWVETEYGREDARCVLGHTTPQTTAIYAESVERAAKVVAKMG
jgi:integrase